MKIVMLLPTATKDMHMKFETEILKPKNLTWPPGSHSENEVTENQ